MKASERIGAACKKHPRPVFMILFAIIGAYMLFSFSPFGENAWKSLYENIGLANFSAYADGFPISVHVLSVGKADAILLESQDTFVLVDGCTYDRSHEVIEYLHTRGIKRLDAVVASHPDSDHIGGLAAIVDAFGAGALYTNGFSFDGSREAFLLGKAVENSGVEVKTLKSGSHFSVGEMDFTVFAPQTVYEDTNDNSIVMKVMYKDFTMLFTGDMAQKELDALLRSDDDLSADILKVPHHGSKTGVSAEFLKRVSPRLSVISVGANTSGLPSDEAVALLEDSTVLRTDENGNLIIASDGSGEYEIKTEIDLEE